MCADTHHVAESALRPHGDGAAPTYEGCARAEALTDDERRLRAETILDVMRGLQDRASLADIIVIARCLKRLEVMRESAWSAAEIGHPLGLLDEAIMLELTDIRLESEYTAAQAEDAARDVERDRAGLTGRSANTTADEQPRCKNETPGRWAIPCGDVHSEHCPVLVAAERGTGGGR